MARQLRDHLAKHAPPARVGVALQDGARPRRGGEDVLVGGDHRYDVVEAAVGDDPAAVAARAAEEHGLSESAARRLAAALAARQWPFDYASMCGGHGGGAA